MSFPFFKRSKPSLSELPKPPVPFNLGNTPAQPGHAEMLRGIAELHNKRMTRTYDAAMTNALSQDFRPTVTSANAEILTSLYISRGRARSLVANFPTAKSIQRTFQNNTVGHDPFRLKMRCGKWVDGKFKLDAELNRMIEAEWKIAGRPENFSVRKDMSRLEGYRIIEAAAVRDGGILARHWPGYPDNRYNYAIDLLEIDRLQESYMGKAPVTGNEIRFSIERNSWQAQVAYWILTRHPGDVFGYNAAKTGVNASQFRERVEAKNIIHFNNLRDRAEQDVGMTELDSVIQTLHRDRQYDISLMYAAIASCCKPFWIKKEWPTGMQYNPELMDGFTNQVVGPLGVNGAGTGVPNGDPVATQKGLGTRQTVMSPATTEVFDYGTSLQQVDPKFPIEATESFKRDNMRFVAAGTGLAYQSVSADYQNLGFSATRSSEMPQRDWFMARQEHMILNFVSVHFNKWLEYAILSGRLPGLDISKLEDYINASNFIGRRWAYINPLQDAQADILQLQAKIVSPQQVQDGLEGGRDIEEVYSDWESAEYCARSHGFTLEEEEPVTAPMEGDPAKGKPTTDDTARGGAADIPPKKGGKQTLRRHFQRYPVHHLEGDGRNGYSH